ncbi:MAG: lipopolysaccharide biosynthesis protein [Pirellula sp.]|jgi:O-antigen/teichoic acid export membrane protein|nr:lipopolysaccharide biosynthesis protein [Pirellula sp.]
MKNRFGSHFVSAVAVADQGIVSFTNFVTVILLASYCGDSVFAAIALSGQAISYFRSAQDRLISAPYAAFIHRPEVQADTYTGSSLRHSMWFVLLVSSVAGCAALAFFALTSNKVVGLGVLAQCLLLPCILLRDHLRFLCFSRFRINFAFVVDALASALQLSILLLLVFAGLTDGVSVTLGLVVSCILPIVCWFVLKPIPYVMSSDRYRVDWIQNWQYSKWLLFGRLFGVASYLLIPWMIAFQRGDSETAIFAKAMNLVGVSTLFVSGLNNYFQPTTVHAFHHGGVSSLRTKLLQNGAVFVAVLGGLCVLYYYIGDWLMKLVYRTDHADQGSVVLILGANVLAYSLAIVASNGLAAFKSSIANFWAEFGNFAVSLSAAVIILPTYGLIGAAVAIAVGSVASALITLILLQVELRRGTREAINHQ